MILRTIGVLSAVFIFAYNLKDLPIENWIAAALSARFLI